MADEIVVGAAVVTADGETLGTVKTVQESAFQVDAPRALDYWLESTLVKASTAARLDLAFNHSELGGYKMDKPFDHNAFREGAPKHLGPDAVRDSLGNR